MRSHAKAPSAFTHGRTGLIALALAMTLSLWLVNATGASAATKFYDSTIGTTSALAGGFPPSPASTNYGGFFSTANGGIGDIAVNDPSVDDGNGADGFIYVVDRGNNRVQAFGADGSFKWTIGRDVVAPSVNEAQLLDVDATAGQFKLKFGADTTIDFAWNVSAATIQTELRKLPSLGGPGANTNVAVTGTAATATVPGRYAIVFTGATYANTDQPPIQVQPGTTALTGSAQITTQANGSPTPGAGDTSEIQTVTVGGGAAGGDFTLSLGASGTTTTPAIPFGAEASTVDAELEKLTAIGVGGVSVSGEDGGPYTVQFTGAKASVDQAQITANAAGLTPSGTVAVATTQDGASFEKCTVAGQCKIGTTATVANSALGNGGTFNVATGIEVDQETGDVFVRERNANSRVQQFSATGEFIRAFGWDVVQSGPGNTGDLETCNAAAGDICKAGVTGDNANTDVDNPNTGPNPGQFGSSTENAALGLAFGPTGAPNEGELYVSDPGNCRIQRFDVPASGTAAVSAGDPFGTMTAGVEQASSAPSHMCLNSSRFAPRDLAADVNGVVYGLSFAPAGGDGIKRFDTTAAEGAGAFMGGFETFGTSNQLCDSGGAKPTSIEIDPASGHLLLARGAAVGVTELDLSEKPEQVECQHVVESHVSSLGVATLGLGVGGGRFFLATASSIGGTGAGQRLLVLDENGVQPAPIVTIAPPDPVGTTTATFKGNVDPVLDANFKTFYRWQLQRFSGGEGFVKDPGFLDATASVEVPPNGFTKSDVEHNATGLDPNTLYRLRIRTDRNPDAGFAFSPNQLFLTEAAAPVVETLPARQVADASARLFGRLNPGGLATIYWFEYGEGSLSETIPVPAAQALGGHDRFVAELPAGLEPETAYQFRLCADNGLSPDKVCGDTLTLQTRPTAISPTPGRSFEMVLPPDKPLRTGSQFDIQIPPGFSAHDYHSISAGMPSYGGGRFMHRLFAGVTDAENGAGSNWEANYDVRRRHPGGAWSGDAILNVAPPAVGANATVSAGMMSAELSTSAWSNMTVPIFRLNGEPSLFGSTMGVRVLGDTGGPLGAGWYPWLDSAWYAGQQNQNGLAVVVTDDRLVEQSPIGRDFTPADGGGAPSQLTPPQSAGNAVFVRDAEDEWAPGDYVNECAGAGATATPLPSRDDGGTPSGPLPALAGNMTAAGAPGATTLAAIATGLPAGARVGHFVTGPGLTLAHSVRVTAIDSDAGVITVAPPLPGTVGTGSFSIGQDTAALADDRLETRPCAAGSPTDVRGAVVGAGRGESDSRLGSSTSAAMSADGRRVFFLSPDPAVSTGQSACEVGDADTHTGTRCPAQLYVRQYDSDGDPVVRWLSRPEDDLFYEAGDPEGEPQMSPAAALGTGASFEGASLDGRYVFFRTDAPLTGDDPNGGLDPLVEASQHSWDLYRYDLGADLDADPASGDPGDRLLRVSGGFGAAADPNTNCAAVPTTGADVGKCVGGLNSQTGASNGSPNGAGNALRFLSDDGRRAYFVTAAGIPGADNARPENGVTEASAAGARVNGATRNLYLHDAAESGAAAWKFIAQVPYAARGLDGCLSRFGSSGRDGGSPHQASNRLNVDVANVTCVHGSGSGDAIVFESTAQLSADDEDEAVDVYLYDAAADRLDRLSAPPPGAEPYPCLTTSKDVTLRSCNGDFGFARLREQMSFGQVGYRHWHVAQDAQGRMTQAFFETRIPLIEADQNAPDAHGDGGMDVYQWNRADGRLSLVSPGSDTESSSFFQGNSLDGKDVYFWTEQRISPWEQDESDGDIYNATTRTDLKGDPPPPPPACDVLAGACQGPPPAAPAANRGSSVAISGEGNFSGPEAKPKPRCTKNQVRRGNRCVAKRTLAQQRCAKRKGDARRRCVSQQVRRLNRTANADRRAAR